jgi:hypothetical protein
MRKVNASVVIETKEKGMLKKISYSGNAEGLKDLYKIIKAMK